MNRGIVDLKCNGNKSVCLEKIHILLKHTIYKWRWAAIFSVNLEK